MDLERLTALLSDGRRRAGSLEHDVLPAGVVLAARLVALYPLIPDLRSYIRPRPGAPVVGVLDPLTAIPDTIWLAGPAVYLLALAVIWLTPWVRAGAAVCGSVMLLGLVVDLGAYSNNRLLAALVLVLIGLYEPATALWPLRLQFCLMYAGAAINKLFDADWRDGTFIGNWTGEVLDLRVFGAVRDAWGGADAGLSWLTIAFEAGLAVLFLLPRHTRVAVGLAVLFHGGMLVLTEGAISWLFAFVVGTAVVAFLHPRRVEPWLAAVIAFRLFEWVIA